MSSDNLVAHYTYLHALLLGIRLPDAPEQAASRHRREGSSAAHGSDTRLGHASVLLLALTRSCVPTGGRGSRPAACPPSEKKVPHPLPECVLLFPKQQSSRICWSSQSPTGSISLPITSHGLVPVAQATRAGAVACPAEAEQDRSVPIAGIAPGGRAERCKC